MKNNYIPVNGHPEFVKDNRSGAILNVDNNAFELFKKQNQQKLNEINKLKQMETDITKIKQTLDELKELKSMLQQLLEANNK